jgi:TRAP-type C4-dicarboxylate transport system substrate-binding protein
MTTPAKPGRIAALFLVGLLTLSAPLSALTIKIGSLAPDNSPWDKALKRVALEWQQISGGRVTVKIYGGGIAGDEADMLRKMRINQIQGAAITGSGIGQIDPDFLVYQLPFVARTDDELDYLFARLRPRLEDLLEQKGFTFIAFVRSGWLRFFSKTPVTTPEDMRKLKFYVMEGTPEVDQAWKEMGFHIVPLPPNDAFAGLQSGMVEVFSASPLTAASLQWFALAPNMTDFNWAPLTAGLIITNQAWRQVPSDLRPRLKEAAQQALDGLAAEVGEVESQAIKIMKDNGLVVHHVTPDELKEWEQLADTAFSILVGHVISRDIYDEAKAIIAEYRSRK